MYNRAAAYIRTLSDAGRGEGSKNKAKENIREVLDENGCILRTASAR